MYSYYLEAIMKLDSHHLQEAVNNVDTLIKRVKSGRSISDEDAQLLIKLIENGTKLRNIAIRHDYESQFTYKKLTEKYALSRSRIYQIANIPDDSVEQRQLKLNL